MKILFLARHYTYFRNYASVLRELAARGHTVHAAVERDEAFGGLQLMQTLAAEYPGITYGEAPARAADEQWRWAASLLRVGIDYFRYQHPLFDDTPRLRERSRDRTPELFVALSRLPGVGRWLRRPITALLRSCERAIPGDAAIDAYLAEQRPDVVLITPLVDLGSSQIDYLRAARRMGIPTALCVWSWDHLSSKALIRDLPDRVFVWNEVQKQEAMDLHRVPADRVVVTGAQCFDQWFDRAPSRSRAEFCAAVGLPADRPFLLYVCSALFGGSPPEAAFVVDWIRHLRAAAPPRVRHAPILVRPHPSRLDEWSEIDLRQFPDVVRYGDNPVDDRSKADYFDSLYYSAAVVGLNTSAFIEAGIVGRPVFTVLLPEFYENQMGTIHFRYLRTAGGGLLNVADDLVAHGGQLDAALAEVRTEQRPFVQVFVRPNGVDVAATPLFADGVEWMASIVPRPARASWLAPMWQSLLTRLNRHRDHPRFARWLLSEREYASTTKLRALQDMKTERRVALTRARDERRRQWQARRERILAERAAQRAAKEAEAARQRAAKEAAKAARLAEKERVRDERLAAKRQAKDAAKRRAREERQAAAGSGVMAADGSPQAAGEPAPIIEPRHRR